MKYCGVKSFNPVYLQNMLNDAKSYAEFLNGILLLMKNSGVILCGISFVFLLIISLFSHGFKSNVLSYFSLLVILWNYLYIFLIDSNYGFYDTTYFSLFGNNIPELDVMALIVLTPLTILYILNVILRR